MQVDESSEEESEEEVCPCIYSRRQVYMSRTGGRVLFSRLSRTA